MARNEKKSKYIRLNLKALKAQSTLEYAIIFPMLFFMIMGIWELAFMWHQYNSAELVLQDISSNIALLDGNICSVRNDVNEIIQNKTGVLHQSELSFETNISGNSVTYISNQQYKSEPIVRVNIDCSAIDEFDNLSPIVQLKTRHKLLFFSGSLPNFRTGGRIVIIPEDVQFVTSKSVTVKQY